MDLYRAMRPTAKALARKWSAMMPRGHCDRHVSCESTHVSGSGVEQNRVEHCIWGGLGQDVTNVPNVWRGDADLLELGPQKVAD